ncbi:MAG: uroporphyrinogen-III synthase [Bacteroidales bacterium]|nr:uroporphyrinogen-III synthase [Bacteroidales bacterium]
MKIKRAIVSQPTPAELEKSPYYFLTKKYNIKVDYLKFFQIEGLSSLEFRQQKISLFDYSAVIFTSKHSVDHYFRIAKDIRLEITENMRYFCVSEAVALYLQKYTSFRKRKNLHANQSHKELIDLVKKHRTEKFFLPISENAGNETDALKDSLVALKVEHTSAVMYRSVPSDLSSLDPNAYDMFVLFSPIGVQGFKASFPDFQQEERLFAAYGKGTQEAMIQAGLTVNIPAPTPTIQSMPTAIEAYLAKIMKPTRRKQ